MSKGQIPWIKGKHHKQESIDKISEALRIRNISEETRKKLVDSKIGDKNPNFGKHPSLETIEKRRQKNKGKVRSEEIKQKFRGKNNSMFGKPAPDGAGRGIWSYYDSPLQGRIRLRSSYELALAKYYDTNKILWMYEIETFDLGKTTYTPDFFLPKEDKFVEVKGYMSLKSQEKINMFLEQYPWDLEILMKKRFNKNRM